MSTARDALTTRTIPFMELSDGSSSSMTAPPPPLSSSLTPETRAAKRFEVTGNAIVTGGCGALGLAASRALLEHGLAGLALLDFNASALESTVTSLQADFPSARIIGQAVDVTDDADVTTAVEKASRAFGRITILLCFAGIVGCRGKADGCSRDRGEQRAYGVDIDKVGRRPLLCWGEANMAISQAGVAAIVAVFGKDFKTHLAAGNGAAFLIYWSIANYAVAYGPVGWVVVAEVFPLNARAKGISISSSVNWIMNFAVAQVTPVMLSNIGYKTFLVFMSCCVLGFFWALLILPELKGLSLEEIDRTFKDKTSVEYYERFQRIARDTGLDKAVEVMEHTETVREAHEMRV